LFWILLIFEIFNIMIIFRSDSSDFIGSGHVKRCLSLAKEIKKRGFESLFICNDFKGNLISEIEKDFRVLKLPKIKKLPKKETNYVNKESYTDWLGCSEKEDAINTFNLIANLKNINIYWIIIDHYSIGEKWEKNFLAIFKNFDKSNYKIQPKIFVIDDLAHKKHYCDLLLNQNYYSYDYYKKYNNKISENTKLLVGPQYALLSSEYTEAKQLIFKREKVKRVLIYFGNCENSIHEKVIKSISNKRFAEISFDYIISKKSKYFEFLKQWEKKLDNLVVMQPKDSLASLILRSDLFIGAGGTTTWERLCLDIPSIVVIVADNQKKISANLHKDKYIKLIGDARNINHQIISAAILEFINQKIDLKKGIKLVDGLGVSRVVNHLLGDKSSMKLTKN